MNGLVFTNYKEDQQTSILNYLIQSSSKQFGHEPDFKGQNYETAPIPDLVVHFYRKHEGALMKDYKKDTDYEKQDLALDQRQH